MESIDSSITKICGNPPGIGFPECTQGFFVLNKDSVCL